MDQEIEVKHTGLKWLILISVSVFIAILLYFVIAARFTPSWLLGEEVSFHNQSYEIQQSDLEAHRNLESFLVNITRNTSNGEKGVQVLIKGTNGEGKRLKNFLNTSSAVSSFSYPYIVKYNNKYYGLDILFQFKSPWILGITKDE